MKPIFTKRTQAKRKHREPHAQVERGVKLVVQLEQPGISRPELFFDMQRFFRMLALPLGKVMVAFLQPLAVEACS